jgi:hypothetical protein
VLDGHGFNPLILIRVTPGIQEWFTMKIIYIIHVVIKEKKRFY